MPDTPTPAGESRPAGPRLSYDVPQEVSYSGDSYMVLQVDPSWFAASYKGDTSEVPS